MERLFSPWRSKYIESFSRSKEEEEKCILCTAHQSGNDDEHLIVTRGSLCYVIMNLYPYNSGHLMIVPFRHLSVLNDLTEDESAEMMRLVRRMTVALQSVAHPHGFNVGCNIGRSAGAGIDQHIHFHVVPRWNGDTNFMPVLSDTKLISEDMADTLQKLRKALK
jgi:ATP adenylyltransferase